MPEDDSFDADRLWRRARDPAKRYQDQPRRDHHQRDRGDIHTEQIYFGEIHRSAPDSKYDACCASASCITRMLPRARSLIDALGFASSGSAASL